MVMVLGIDDQQGGQVQALGAVHALDGEQGTADEIGEALDAVPTKYAFTGRPCGTAEAITATSSPVTTPFLVVRLVQTKTQAAAPYG